ncbi:MAG: hypothetical protein HYZ42_00595 [Bacteroidetes bacterium]|nr:hypothetical protein [Bacteroidota bacterium]
MIKVAKYVFIFILYIGNIKAQRANNWVLGWHAGINFSTSPPNTFLSQNQAINSPKNGPTGSQSISDCNGDLLFYVANGGRIWNRFHQVVPSDSLLTNEYLENCILPKIGDDSTFYIFHAHWGKKISYTTFDLRLDSGRGDISKAYTNISDSSSGYIGVIKHANDTDYWLLYFTNGNTICAYLFDKNGVSTKPIHSICNYPSYQSSGILRSSNNGNFLIIIGGLLAGYVTYYIYNFDKSTGKVYNRRNLVRAAQKKCDLMTTFSPNDSMVYFFGPSNKSDSLGVYQAYPYDTDPSSTFKLVDYIKYNKPYNSSFQMGPDNRLYLSWSNDTGKYATSLSYIKYPNQKGFRQCGIVMSGIKAQPPSYFNTFSFPTFMFPVKYINNKFSVTGENNCGHDTIRFTFEGDSAFHSAWWYFGDGDSAQEVPTRNASGQKIWSGVVHQYKQAGSYYVRLACGLGSCGYKQWVGDSITIKFKPNLSFVTNKTIHCGYQTIQADIQYKYTDTLKLSWGDGSDTMIVDSSRSVAKNLQLQHVYTQSGNYIVSCKAWNANCYDSAASIYTIKIDPQPTTAFQTNNFASCGASTSESPRLYRFSYKTEFY